MTDFDPSKLLDAASRFFDLTRKQLCLIFSVMVLAGITAYIDRQSTIASLPRWVLTSLYLFGILCAVFLCAVFVSHHYVAWRAGKAEADERKASTEKALTNLRSCSKLHRASLTYLKRQNKKHFYDEDWNTLMRMAASGLLTIEQARPTNFWYDVPDPVWNSPELARWLKEMPTISAPPWDALNMMQWS